MGGQHGQNTQNKTNMRKSIILRFVIAVVVLFNFNSTVKGIDNKQFDEIVFKNCLDSCSQIILNDGDAVSAIILEVYPNQIKYKKCDRVYSPIYVIESSRVEKIIYPDGSIDILNSVDDSEDENNMVKEENDQDYVPRRPDPKEAYEKMKHVYLYESQDVIYDSVATIFLKNGLSINGFLVKKKADKYIQIKTASGQINTYKFLDIDHVDYFKNDDKVTPF